MTRPLLTILAAATVVVAAAALPAPDADNGGLTLPPGFRALVVADGLVSGGNQLRFLAAAPNGDLYAKTIQGGIIALHDADGDGRFETRREFGSGGGTGIAFHGDWLYHSTNTAVYRYPYRGDELVPAGPPERIVRDLPEQRSHAAKAFAFDDQGRLLLEIGSPYNVYSEPDRQFGATGRDPAEHLKRHGGFWRFDAARPEQTQAEAVHFSTGHRHCLAIAWQPVAREFYMVMMGRDNLSVVAPEHYDALDNAERVAEELHRLHEGADLGWPTTYWDPIKQARMLNPEFGGDNRRRAEPGRFPDPLVAFPAHWAPLQMVFYSGAQFPAKYHGGAFIAFHGSWNRAPLPQDGYNICFVPFDERGTPRGNYEVFAANAGPQRFRMGGVSVAPDGSLFISETDRGRIWRIIHLGGQPSGSVTAARPPAAPAADLETTIVHPGRAIYEKSCAVCHMPDGSGAGRLNPALTNSAVVAGPAEVLVDIVLRGSQAAWPKDRPRSANLMPGFPQLEDRPIAELVSYLRSTFGAGAAPVTASEVAAVRARRD